MWREALYVKLKRLGFGGLTLKLIKSLYYNDNIKFLINGKYTDPIWLTLGISNRMILPKKPKGRNDMVFVELDLLNERVMKNSVEGYSYADKVLATKILEY